MKNLFCILVLLVVMSYVGVFVMVDAKIKSLEEEIQQKEIMHKYELEEIKKKQRITAQYVDFLEKIIKEEL